MDDYDLRRLSVFQSRTLRIAPEDLKSLVAAHPELSVDDVDRLAAAEDDGQEDFAADCSASKKCAAA